MPVSKKEMIARYHDIGSERWAFNLLTNDLFYTVNSTSMIATTREDALRQHNIWDEASELAINSTYAEDSKRSDWRFAQKLWEDAMKRSEPTRVKAQKEKEYEAAQAKERKAKKRE